MLQILEWEPSLASPAVMCREEAGTWLTIPSDKNGEPLAEEDRLEAGQLTNNEYPCISWEWWGPSIQAVLARPQVVLMQVKFGKHSFIHFPLPSSLHFFTVQPSFSPTWKNPSSSARGRWWAVNCKVASETVRKKWEHSYANNFCPVNKDQADTVCDLGVLLF